MYTVAAEQDGRRENLVAKIGTSNYNQTFWKVSKSKDRANLAVFIKLALRVI